MRRLLAPLTAVLLLASTFPGVAAADDAETTSVDVYLLLDQPEAGPFLVPVAREVGTTAAIAAATIETLLAGPTEAEVDGRPAVSTGVPEGVELHGVTIDEGLATVDLSADFAAGGGSFAMLTRLGQLVYTVTQFDTVDGLAIELDGEPITVFSGEGIDVTPPVQRSDLDGTGVLPPIFVDAPSFGATFAAQVTGSSTVGSVEAFVFDGDGRTLGAAATSLAATDGRAPFELTVPYIAITERFGHLIVEGADTAATLREYPVTLAQTPVPVGRSHEAACPAVEVPHSGFLDVGASTHTAAIDCITWWGITTGRTVTTYEPAGTITRGQMASMLARAMETAGETLPTDPPAPFADVAGTTHAPAIDQLAALGIVQGRDDGTFAPGDAVNRAQMAALLIRTFEAVTAVELDPPRDYFVDDDGSIHEPAIDAAALAGLTAGQEGDRFAPGAELRRDQMATFMARLLDLFVVEGAVILE